MAISHTAQANILETFDFETGDLSQVGSTETEGASASVSASSAQARQGTYSMRSYMQNQDKRAEIVSSRRGTVGGEHWYGWSIYLPANAGDTTQDIISQFHDWHSSQPSWAKDGVAPTCIVAKTNGHLQMDLKFQKIGLNETEHDYFDLGAFTPNAWNDIVIHVKWTHETTGFMKIWVNGVLQMDYTGPTYLDYGPGNGPYFKMGNYKGVYHWSGDSPRTYYMDEYRMGDAYASYADVNPARSMHDAALIAYEGFDYAVGSVDGANGGIGWASAWSEWGNGGDASTIADSFSYASLASTGNRFRVYDTDGNRQGIVRTLSTTLGATEGTYWISFIAKKNHSGREAYIEFGDMALRAYQSNDWEIKTPDTSYTTLTGAGYAAQHLFLIRVDAGAVNDTVSAWVDPDLASGEPSTGSALVTLTDAGGFTFDTVNIQHGVWGNAMQSSEWDELRIGESFAAVTPAPSAPLFVYEAFDYATGSLDGADGGFGWSTPWIISGGAGYAEVLSAGFDYTNLVSQGNRFKIYDTDGVHQTATRQLAQSVGAETGEYWLSFLTKKNSSGRTSSIDFGGLSFKAASGDWQVKGPTTSYATITGAAYNELHFFLVRMDASPAGNTIHVWVDPDLSLGEPSTSGTDLTLSDEAFFSFNTLAIKHGPFGNSSQSAEWDELRVGTSFADVVTGDFTNALETDADAYVRNGSYANTNHGLASSLWVKADASDEYNRRIFLRFDLSGYSGSITSATLSLMPNTVGSGIANTDLQAYLVSNDSWAETGITWNNQPGYSTLLDTISGSTIQNGVAVEFDLSSAASSEQSGDGALSIVIVSTSAGSDRYVVFDSYEAAGDQPLLILE
ncbi:DUF7594 domain-containing protein [Cerasicoccus fimbriatus]|uniref:CBM96 family carbohydrate-binding protein n=1 Tax=Cerasicoccus fimbriatus TaxID=3014554 RepID=UPI0022B47083|nr:heparin lyase I family protein [Cerasicoccus sp. TK19100]